MVSFNLTLPNILLYLAKFSAEEFVFFSSLLMLFMCTPTFLSCLYLEAPYGRYSPSSSAQQKTNLINKFGLARFSSWNLKLPSKILCTVVPARFAWFLMESPTLWCTVLVLFFSITKVDETNSKVRVVISDSNFLNRFGKQSNNSYTNAFALSLFVIHYIQRAIIYPIFRMSPSATPMPVSIMVMAFVFCVWNGLNQSLSLMYVDDFPKFKESWEQVWIKSLFPFQIRYSLWEIIRLFLGFRIYCYGFSENIHADEILLNLKKEAIQELSESNMKSRNANLKKVNGDTELKRIDEGGPDSENSTVVKSQIRNRQPTSTKNDNHTSDDSSDNHTKVLTNSKTNFNPKSDHESSSSSSETEEKSDRVRSVDDTILQAARRRYKIPYGGLFKYVSCANYLAEIIEWIGFMIVCWNLPSFAFAMFTFANMAPRARHHHKWYVKTFGEEYKRLNRKAIIPYVW